jgi:phosphodiesterase/alkaline phosphatase D-like protein
VSTFVASNTATSQGTTSLTIPLPSGWAAGHLCFLAVSVNDGSVTITPPSGWTAIDSSPVVVGSSQMSVWRRVLQAGDSNPQVGLSASFKCSGITAAYSGVDQGSPIAAVGTRGTRGGSSTSTVAGSVTTTAADQRVVGFFMEKSSTASSVTDPSGTTRRAVAFTTGGGAVSSLVVDEEVASSGATGTRTAVYNVASSIGYGLLVAIADGAPTPGSVTHAWVGANTTDGFQVVAKLGSATSVRLAVSTNSGMTSPVYTSADAPDGDGYVRLTITGLSADTDYWWQLADTPSGGSESLIGNVGKASTLPTGNASFQFAFSACQTNNNPDSEALDNIRAWGPLFFLHTGDLHYRDPSSTDADVHRGFIEGQIVGAGGLAQLLREVPTYYTRSDHDTAGDNSDSNTDVGLASIAAYRQVVPHPPLAAPTDDSLHYSFVCGRLRFIVLDIRNHYRSTGSDAQSSSKTMLGADQKQWLKDELLEAEPVKVIVSDVGWIGAASLSQGADKWWSYDDERTEIGNYIVAQGLADSVVMLTGDNHALLSDDGTNNLWGGFAVWGAAPLANISGGRYLNSYQQKYSPDPQEDVRNYGRVTVVDDGATITLTFSGWDALNEVERVDGELVVNTLIGRPGSLSTRAGQGTLTAIQASGPAGRSGSVALHALVGSVTAGQVAAPAGHSGTIGMRAGAGHVVAVTSVAAPASAGSTRLAGGAGAVTAVRASAQAGHAAVVRAAAGGGLAAAAQQMGSGAAAGTSRLSGGQAAITTVQHVATAAQAGAVRLWPGAGAVSTVSGGSSITAAGAAGALLLRLAAAGVLSVQQVLPTAPAGAASARGGSGDIVAARQVILVGQMQALRLAASPGVVTVSPGDGNVAAAGRAAVILLVASPGQGPGRESTVGAMFVRVRRGAVAAMRDRRGPEMRAGGGG